MKGTEASGQCSAGHQHNVNPKDEVRDVPKTRTRYKWTPWNQEYQQQYEIKETVTVNEESVTFDEKQSQVLHVTASQKT